VKTTASIRCGSRANWTQEKSENPSREKLAWKEVTSRGNWRDGLMNVSRVSSRCMNDTQVQEVTKA